MTVESKSEDFFSLVAKKNTLLVFAQYALTICLSLVLAISVLHWWNANWLKYPFSYSWDSLFHAMMTQSIISTGWYTSNPSIGAPEGQYLFDFPWVDTFNFFILKIISLFSSNWVVVNNLFFLLSFPFSAATALFVMRRFGIWFPFALTGSLLFALMPYHFFRGVEHLFLSSYFVVPLGIWLSIFIYDNHTLTWRKNIPQLLGFVLLCLLIGSCGIYYAFFSAFFVGVSGLITAYVKKQIQALGLALFFVGVISFAVLLNLLPSFWFNLQNGPNLEICKRVPFEAELYGLKLSQLLLPIQGDRISILAHIREKYDTGVLINENSRASLGVIGSIGFLILLIRMFVNRNQNEQKSSSQSLSRLSELNLAGVLLATIGGAGALFALFISPSIRCYNRISIFLAFFSLAAVCLFLQSQLEKRNLHNNHFFAWLLGLFMLCIGTYNQTSGAFSFEVKLHAMKDKFDQDKAFFHIIDRLLPKDSMIFQLPYMSFPESSPIHQMADYEHFRAPLHSKRLKWSYGAMKGRPTARWQQEICSKSVPIMLECLIQKGFKGIYINRRGYSDHGKALEAELSRLIPEKPLISRSGNESFWNLRSFLITPFVYK